MVLVVGPVLVVVVVEVLGTVVVLTGAVVVVVVLVMVVVVLGATVVLVEVVGLDVLLVSAASAPLAGKKAMAATTAPTVTTVEPSLDKAGLPRPAGVVGRSCRGWPPPAMAIDWPIRDGARCAVPDVLLRPGPAQQRSPAGRQPPRALSGPPSPARNDLLERIPPDRIVRLLALSGQRVRRAATSQPTGRSGAAPTGVAVTVLSMDRPAERLHRRSVWPPPDGIAICPGRWTLGAGLDLVVQGLTGRRRQLAP